MRRSFRYLFAAGMILLAAPVRAQCTPIPATGCTALAPACSGSTAVGQTLTVTCPPCLGTVSSGYFLILGRCPAQPLPLPFPIVCTNLPCGLGIDPGLSVAIPVAATGIPLGIPPNPRLVGLSLCMQCVCTVPSRACVILSQAVGFRIQ